MFGPAGQQRLVKRLLLRKQHPRLRFRQIAGEVVQEGGLAQPVFVAVETMPADAGGAANFCARAA